MKVRRAGEDRRKLIFQRKDCLLLSLYRFEGSRRIRADGIHRAGPAGCFG
jgi:hypothetical protein